MAPSISASLIQKIPDRLWLVCLALAEECRQSGSLLRPPLNAACDTLLQLLQYLIKGEARCLLARREILERCQEPARDMLRQAAKTYCQCPGMRRLALGSKAGFDFSVLVPLALLAAFFTSDVLLGDVYPKYLLPQKGAEQGEDAQQRDKRCHYSCQRWRQARAVLMQYL